MPQEICHQNGKKEPTRGTFCSIATRKGRAAPRLRGNVLRHALRHVSQTAHLGVHLSLAPGIPMMRVQLVIFAGRQFACLTGLHQKLHATLS